MNRQTREFLSYLHRGGTVATFWHTPKKQTIWFPVGEYPALPQNDAQWYYGVHPVRHAPTHNHRGIAIGEVDPSTGLVVRQEYLRSQIAIIESANCLYAEFDGKDFGNDLHEVDRHIANLPVAPPSAIVSSGFGRHCYWFFPQPFMLSTDDRRERLRQAQSDFVGRVQGDKASKDLARVLRIPGTLNRKYEPPVPVEFIELRFDRVYALNDLQPVRPVRAEPVRRVELWTDTHRDEIAVVTRALNRLHPLRADDYDDWFRVGLALRDLGATGLQLWHDWSSQSNRYDPHALDARWSGMNSERRGVGLGTLMRMAAEDDPHGEPQRVRPLQRRVQAIQRPAAQPVQKKPSSIDRAREELLHAAQAYIDDPTPTDVLVLAAQPGVGKTYLAVQIAEAVARSGKRVLYCAPRRDFFDDIQKASIAVNGDAQQLPLWYPWQARTTEQADGSTPCLYPRAMESWLAKGHAAINLCSSKLCGWQYVSGDNACPYHRQKEQREPIIFGQHAHAVLGHPMLDTASLVIGDENPLSAFFKKWRIPRKHIMPSWLPPDDRLTDLLDTIHTLSQRVEVEGEDPLSGTALLAELGGAEVVMAAVANPVDIGKSPFVRNQADVTRADYNHVAALCGMLEREAEEALAGRACIDRVIVTADGLTLLQGYEANSMLPPHVIWLDATANEDIYAELFAPRKVRIVRPHVEQSGSILQVTDRSWARTTLISQEGELAADDDGSAHLPQLQQVTRRIVEKGRSLYDDTAPVGYSRPAVITYKDLKQTVFADVSGLHFYGNRGSNALQEVDALIVAGTPQPPQHEVVTMAKMLFKRRTRPFDTAWRQRWKTFDGQFDDAGNSLAYPVSTFVDPDLQAIHWQLCEAELIQAVHRARPVIRDVDVWLLSNRPLDFTPIKHLFTLRELLTDGGTPQGFDPWTWSTVLPWANERFRRVDDGQIAFDSRELRDTFNLTSATAQKYLQALAEQLGGSVVNAVMKGRGRPAKGMRK
jgi:hypothetical protein